MYVGHFVFAREECGEVVCIGSDFKSMEDPEQRPHSASFRAALADWLLRADINDGQIKLFRGVYQPCEEEKFCGSVIDVHVEIEMGRLLAKRRGPDLSMQEVWHE